MGILDFLNKPIGTPGDAAAAAPRTNFAGLAETALNSINDGVIVVDERGAIKMANPAALTMTGYPNLNGVLGLDVTLILKLENNNGQAVAETENPLTRAIQANTPLKTRKYSLIPAQGERRIAIGLSLVPAGDTHSDKIITFRDITTELKEENEQAEFISTASHEMRTPVASIEGYLGLALNPSTATIDERARQYLTAAHAASQHLGRLFRDLLDTTQMDDGKMKVHLAPVEIVQLVKQLANEHAPQMSTKHIQYAFGTPGNGVTGRQVEQLAYALVDVDFLREILDNLIENAIKYTPDGGAVWVNARGDGDRVLISVTDTGIGISPDDLTHIFQKFYRVDNSQTRTIGGTGLGLYLVEKRAEAMNGKVWAESEFGKGTTFYVSLPRISADEYARQKIAFDNQFNNQQNGGIR